MSARSASAHANETQKSLLKLGAPKSRKAPFEQTVIRSIDKGLDADVISNFVKLGFPRNELIQVVGARSTIERKIKNKARLTPTESDRLARLARIIALAESVFANRDKALHWLQRPNKSLHAGEPVPPYVLAGTDPGAKLVEERLLQIGHGVFA
jgi:putative toxin-antitoxin system antitoxin component (TIGR02293 family)